MRGEHKSCNMNRDKKPRKRNLSKSKTSVSYSEYCSPCLWYSPKENKTMVYESNIILYIHILYIYVLSHIIYTLYIYITCIIYDSILYYIEIATKINVINMILYYIILYYIMLYYVILYYIILLYYISYHIISYHIILKYIIIDLIWFDFIILDYITLFYCIYIYWYCIYTLWQFVAYLWKPWPSVFTLDKSSMARASWMKPRFRWENPAVPIISAGQWHMVIKSG